MVKITTPFGPGNDSGGWKKGLILFGGWVIYVVGVFGKFFLGFFIFGGFT